MTAKRVLDEIPLLLAMLLLCAWRSTVNCAEVATVGNEVITTETVRKPSHARLQYL